MRSQTSDALNSARFGISSGTAGLTSLISEKISESITEAAALLRNVQGHASKYSDTLADASSCSENAAGVTHAVFEEARVACLLLDAGTMSRSTTRVAVLTSPLFLMLCAACTSDVTTPSAAISVSAATLNFPQTAIGDTSTASLTLSTTVAESIGLADTDTADFPFTTTCAPSLPAGATCSINVQFHPNTAGSLSAWL